MNNQLTKSEITARLNDEFRRNIVYFALVGQVVTTASVAALPHEDKMRIFEKVRDFNLFTEDNDPYSEHDFGAFSHNADTIFWKIDYYDKSMKYGSEDPSDANVTKRMLTVMFDFEY